MTHRRLNHLLLSAICFLFVLLVLSTAARASDWSWMAQAGIKSTFASSMGYDPGIGIQGEAGVRWKFLENRLSGDWLAQHKKTATSGSHYHIGAELRGYVYGPFYLVGAYERGGYWTHFESNNPDAWAKAGTTWSKHGHHWIGGAGFNDGNTELSLRYGFREHETPNQTDFIGLIVQQRVWKGLFITAEFFYSTWLQNGPGTDRIDGFVPTLGIVFRIA